MPYNSLVTGKELEERREMSQSDGWNNRIGCQFSGCARSRRNSRGDNREMKRHRRKRSRRHAEWEPCLRRIPALIARRVLRYRGPVIQTRGSFEAAQKEVGRPYGRESGAPDSLPGLSSSAALPACASAVESGYGDGRVRGWPGAVVQAVIAPGAGRRGATKGERYVRLSVMLASVLREVTKRGNRA